MSFRDLRRSLKGKNGLGLDALGYAVPECALLDKLAPCNPAILKAAFPALSDPGASASTHLHLIPGDGTQNPQTANAGGFQFALFSQGIRGRLNARVAFH
jgi:hypothetical protein